MAKKFLRPAQKPAEPISKPAPEVKPVLELGELDSKETPVKIGLGEVGPLTDATTPEFAELNKYKVTAKGGVFLREDCPTNTNTLIGTSAVIGCISYGDSFVELKRENKWSYGNYNGISGWVCNIFLEK